MPVQCWHPRDVLSHLLHANFPYTINKNGFLPKTMLCYDFTSGPGLVFWHWAERYNQKQLEVGRVYIILQLRVHREGNSEQELKATLR